MNKLNRYLKGITTEEWLDAFYCDVHEEEQLIYLHLKLLYLDFIVPLVENVYLEDNIRDTQKEPEVRIVYV